MRVRLLVEGDITDAKPVKFASRAAYERLLEHGIEIYEYQPAMMHAKVMVVDDVLAVVGSANFDNRSLELNDELSVAVFDPHLAARLLTDYRTRHHALAKAGFGEVARASAAHPRARAILELFRGSLLGTTFEVVRSQARVTDRRRLPPMEPEAKDGVRRPAGLWLLTVVLLASPAFHLLALFFDTRWLNFGSHQPWDAFVYFVIAPVVGALMLRRHERARFSVYVFLSCEILRAIRIHSGASGSPGGGLHPVPAASRGAAVPSGRGPAQGDGAAALQAPHALRKAHQRASAFTCADGGGYQSARRRRAFPRSAPR